MTVADKLTKIDGARAAAESHAEDMRLSYELAKAQVQCLERERAKVVGEK